MGAKTLKDLCVRACIKNIRSLTDVGSMEYSQCHEVLARIQVPEQLHTIEENSPQIRGEDAKLWQDFIARDIPNWKAKGYVPKNPTKWYEVYCKYKKEQRQEIERDEELLRQRMMGLHKNKESHVSRVVDARTLPKLPKDPYMMANNGGVPLKKNPWGKKEPSGVLSFNAGSRTKTNSPASVMSRARREAREIGQMSKLSRPTHQLSGKIGQVKKAPAGMSKEYQIAAQPALKILSHRHVAPKSTQSVSKGPTLQEREARLKAAMSSGTKRYASGDVKETLVGSSDDDSLGDDLFDEPKPKVAARPVLKPRPAPRPQYRSLIPSSSPRPMSSPATSSSLKSRPRPVASSPATAASSPAQKTASAFTSRPMASSSGPPKPMMQKKRKEVDVFNRGAMKKPKLK